MIPRHPGDPERLPKVSKRTCGALRAAGPPRGPVPVWGQQVPWEGGLPDAPSPAATARPTGAGGRPGLSQVGEGVREGGPRPPVFCLTAANLEEEEKGFSDTNILDSARGT